MVKFFPELDEIKDLRVEPTAGESYLLNFLSKYLGKINGEFEVYFQPPWDGSFPDVVIMRKGHGILIIEVKDWNLNSYSIVDKYSWEVRGQNNKALKKSPIAQANDYKGLFYNTYSRTLAVELAKNSKNFSIVPAAVFFYNATEDELQNFFGEHLDRGDYLSSNYVILLTPDILQRDGLNVFKGANYLLGKYTSKFFTDDIYNELCRVLKPSEYSRMKIAPVTLNAAQKKLATSSTASKQKIKGPAGCGKTTILAHRAVDAFRRTNKPVLILTFNITLCNYIRDCISAALENLPDIKGRKKSVLQKFFVIKHFHLFDEIYRNKTDQLKKVRRDGKKTVSTFEMDATPIKYATILVDEAQDYEYFWMQKIVENFLEPNGEIVYFGDEDQNIYLRAKMSDVKIPQVPGRWNQIKGTYRLSSRIAELARDFQIKFFGGSVGNEIDPQINLFDQTTVKYHYLQNFDKSAIMKICREILAKESNDDICIMSHLVKYVRPIEKALRDLNYKTLTTFETEEEYNILSAQFDEDELKDELNKIRRPAKFAFNMESGKIKLSTIHSYKGWGVPTEILIIGNDAEDADTFLNHEMIYTGITRAIKNLIVINIGEKEVHNFFSDWMKAHNL